MVVDGDLDKILRHRLIPFIELLGIKPYYQNKARSYMGFCVSGSIALNLEGGIARSLNPKED